ncbi:hypothetical protein GCM10023178_18100 [Actinomadura luteofluorescens]
MGWGCPPEPGPILLAGQPAPASGGAATSSNRRESTTARKPDGSSSAKALTDRITSDDETAAGESPVSVNSAAYTEYRRTRSSRNAQPYSLRASLASGEDQCRRRMPAL